VLKAMAKEADGRYATARELGDDLQRFLADRPVLAKRPTLVHRLRKWLARHKAMTAGAMILLLLTTVGFAAATLLIWQKEEETRRALNDSRVVNTWPKINASWLRSASGWPVDISMRQT